MHGRAQAQLLIVALIIVKMQHIRKDKRQATADRENQQQDYARYQTERSLPMVRQSVIR